MSLLKSATFALALMGGAAFAQMPPQTPPPNNPPPQKTMDMPDFKTLDINGDGELSKDECRGQPMVMEHFMELDADKNGTLSQEEYSQAKQLKKR